MPPRILITRSSRQASELAELLSAFGAEPIVIPAIELTEPTSFVSLDDALAALSRFHWLLFTSANAVEAFHRRLLSTHPNSVLSDHPNSVILSAATERSDRAKSKDLQPGWHPAIPLGPSGYKSQTLIAAIGPATARALEAIGLRADLMPPKAVAESLAEALLPHALKPDGTPTRFLLIRAEQAREHLPDTLRAAGADVTIAAAYQTVIPAGSILLIKALFSAPDNYPDAVTFTSSSTATNLIALLDAAGLMLPPEILRISIGPITSKTLRELGLAPHAEATEPTIFSLMGKIAESLNLKRSM